MSSKPRSKVKEWPLKQKHSSSEGHVQEKSQTNWSSNRHGYKWYKKSVGLNNKTFLKKKLPAWIFKSLRSNPITVTSLWIATVRRRIVSCRLLRKNKWQQSYRNIIFRATCQKISSRLLLTSQVTTLLSRMQESSFLTGMLKMHLSGNTFFLLRRWTLTKT